MKSLEARQRADHYQSEVVANDLEAIKRSLADAYRELKDLRREPTP